MELWELVARERIRDTLARYNWSGDALRVDELARTFCVDGELAIRGRPVVTGREAIARLLGGPASDDEARRVEARAAAEASGAQRIVRHHVSNLRFVSLEAEQAHVESYFAVFTQIGLDHYGRYRDTVVPVDGEWLIRHRFVSTDWRSPDSTMTRPPGEST